MGEGARRIRAQRLTATQRGVSRTALLALALALVAFPVYKVQVIDHLPVIERYGETGHGHGLLVWSLCYIGAEVAIAALCVASIRREGHPLADVGLMVPRSRLWWSVLAGVLVVAGAIIALRGADVIDIVGRSGEDYGALVARTTWQRLAIVASSAVAVPIEELIWRGFAVTSLHRLGVPVWAAIGLPSLAFGYFHGGTLETVWISVFVTVAAIVLAVIFLRTLSLAWPILIHFGWNALLASVTPQPA